MRLDPLNRKNTRPKKHLGQNFLYDPAIAERIVTASGLERDDVAVELGPGRGIMTRPLVATGASVIAIEVDDDLIASLRESLPQAKVVHQDLTEVKLADLLAESGYPERGCRLIGNIPYYLTRDVLFDYLVYQFESIESATIMMQREVAERIAASAGGRVYGITSVVLQALYNIRTVMKVAPGSFHPPPKVASMVLRFDPLSPPMIELSERKAFVGLVRGAFAQRRKTLANTLRAVPGITGDALAEAARWAESKLGAPIDTSARPETFSAEAFVALMRGLKEQGADW